MRCALVLAACLALSACFGGAPPPPRYFEPVAPVRAEVGEPPVSEHTVRLRNVEGGLFLGDRIVWRSSPTERGLHDQERWTEPPATYVWRALGEALYERRGLVRGGTDAAHTVDCEVRAFEEVLLPEHAAHVAVWLRLYAKDGTTVLERTFRSQVSIGEESPTAMAAAMGQALDAVVEEAGAAVLGALTR